MKRNTCRMCSGTNLTMFLQLGPQPLAGGFLRSEQLKLKENYYPLDVYFCRDCKLVQLLDVVEKETMFNEYFYAPHSLLSEHFTKYAQELISQFGLNEKSFVVEFGSNVGMMLKPFKDAKIKAVGVEPAKNIAAAANGFGLETVNDFFNETVAKAIAKKYGKADIIIANNVFAHIDNLEEVMLGIKALLKDEGTFVFENHYLGDTVEKLQYDDIYHEHMCYYSLHPVTAFMERHGMKVLDAKRVKTHGGSIRVFCGASHMKVSPSVKMFVEEEKELKLDRIETFEEFAKRVKNHRQAVRKLLTGLKSNGKRIAGYGAPARGNTMLNYCKIGTDILDYTIDDSPLRQGKFTPGMHIPVVSVDRLRSEQPDYAFLLAWGGYTESILKKEKDFIAKGGRFIIPLPETKILE